MAKTLSKLGRSWSNYLTRHAIHVGYGSKADTGSWICDVCSTPENRTLIGSPIDVSFVP
jgi:hypothetical protein